MIMPYEAVTRLDMLVGAAITDATLCAGLLDGRRSEIVQEWDLTPEEKEVILGIEADNLQEFAQVLFRWKQSKQPYAAMVPEFPFR